MLFCYALGNEDRMRVIIYVRVSTAEQAQEGYSIGEQTERLAAFAGAMSWTVVRVCTDPGYSGAKMNRPGLKELIRSVEAHETDKVLVYKLDRLSRSQKDTLYLIEDVFLKNGVDFVSMSENFDTASAFGRATIGILAVFAQLERETIKERMLLGKVGRAKDGYYTGKQILVGYDYIDKLLVPNAYEAMLIRTIFDDFLAGRPISTIAADLNAKGLYHRGRQWYSQTVRRILSNRTYIGEVLYQGVWYVGRHDPIVERDVFDRAQRLLALRAESYTSSNNHVSPLTGFLWCGRCGAKYGRQRWMPKNDGTRKVCYMCYTKSKKCKSMVKAPSCDNKNWETSELESIIFGEIRKLAVDPDYLTATRKAAQAARETEDEARLLRLEADSLTSQISRLMDLYSLGSLSLSEVDAKIRPLAERRDKLEAELKAQAAREGALPADEASELVQSFGDVLDRGDLTEIRLVLTSLIRKIVLDGGDVTIYWNFT